MTPEHYCWLHVFQVSTRALCFPEGVLWDIFLLRGVLWRALMSSSN